MRKQCEFYHELSSYVLQNLSGVEVMKTENTACYNAILQNDGQIIYGIGDMKIHNEITPNVVSGLYLALYTCHGWRNR